MCPSSQAMSVMQASATDSAAGGGPVVMRGDSVSERDSDAAAAVLAKAATIRTSEEGGPAARPINIRAAPQPEAIGAAAALRPLLRDLATGALWDEEGAAPAQRTSSDPSFSAVNAAPFGGRRGALRASISEPGQGYGGVVLGLPVYPGTSPPLSSSGGNGGPLSPRSASGNSRGEEQPLRPNHVTYNQRDFEVCNVHDSSEGVPRLLSHQQEMLDLGMAGSRSGAAHDRGASTDAAAATLAARSFVMQGRHR